MVKPIYALLPPPLLEVHGAFYHKNNFIQMKFSSVHGATQLMANDLLVLCLVIYNLRHMYQISLVTCHVCTKSIFWPWPRPEPTCSDVNMANDLKLAVNPQLKILCLSRLWS